MDRVVYLAHTIPYISFVVSCISQFMPSSAENYLHAAHRILRYLKVTHGQGLMFRKHEFRGVHVFVEADSVGCPTYCHSTTRYSFLSLKPGSWRNKNQPVISHSSAVAELRSTAHRICKAFWLRWLFHELCIQVNSSMSIWCDNKAAISISHNLVHNNRTKHVEVDRHFIKKSMKEYVVAANWITI